jgi:hypothetical protein
MSTTSAQLPSWRDRLARLADKYGAEIRMTELLAHSRATANYGSRAIRQWSGSVVAPSAALMAFCDSTIMGRSSVRPQIIRDELGWDKAIFLQHLAHQSQRRTLVPTALDQHIEHFALGVDGAPEVHHSAIDFQKTSSKCQVVRGLTQRLRRSAANLGPKWFTQRRTVS